MYTTHNLQTGNEHGLLAEEDSSMRQENMPGLPFSKKEMSWKVEVRSEGVHRGFLSERKGVAIPCRGAEEIDHTGCMQFSISSFSCWVFTTNFLILKIVFYLVAQDAHVSEKEVDLTQGLKYQGSVMLVSTFYYFPVRFRNKWTSGKGTGESGGQCELIL